ncbi:M20 metallopeptidase family protein [Caldanaerobius polysaccharolyticus]|uniref:M20 metallopeptidase family protein n=1 Tax=Caldanaerobius polysaccharolyticus TaxID=44256 RepID=UPI000557AD5C|nr:M20 family metallopeptidase [Caldanaerobius polysaccharolyticus]
MQIEESVMNLRDEIFAIRRHLHKHPELSFEEKNTAEFICQYLKKLDVYYESDIAGNGIIGLLKGSRGERTYAFRADMDALPVIEETNVEYASANEGVMHACGHDGHMAILLGLARYLSCVKNKLKENVMLIFEPAEEQTGGALNLIKSGVFDRYKVDGIFGYHIYPDIPEGSIGLKSGPLMAMAVEIDVDIYGKSSHGAMPHKGRDAIVTASQFIQQVQTVVSRKVDPLENAVITFGRIYGGNVRNVVSDRVRLEGTIRALKKEVFLDIKAALQEISKGLCISDGVKIDMDIRETYPPVINDERLYELVLRSVPESDIVRMDPVMLAEDFSFYSQVAPSFYIMLGARNEKKGFVYPLHHCRFNFDENILLKGIQIYINLLRDQKFL